MNVRLATEQDCPAMAAIYAPFVRDTAITFETEAPGAAEFAARLNDTLPAFPWLVCVDGFSVIGYAYAGKHRARAAYRWSVDVSVYIDPAFHRRGVGRRLYQQLIEIVRRQGFYNAYAGITLPNPASVGLHESLGFRPLGVYRRVGYKLGCWHDVGWWELTLRPHDDSPSEPNLI